MATAKGISVSFALAALLAAGGCGGDRNANAPASSAQPSAATAPASLSAEELGTLGARIQKNPSDADRILHERGLTQEQFAAQVRKVAENPAASKRYAAAYRNTKS